MTTPGKTIGSHTYFHLALINHLEAKVRSHIEAASKIAQATPGEHFNVVKISRDTATVSLLNYPDFFDMGFPILRRYWTVDINRSSHRYRTYEDSLNPPILHRKELLLPDIYPDRQLFCDLTSAAEQIGLFHDPSRIGFQRPWEALLTQRGYEVIGHELIPIGNVEYQQIDDEEVASDFSGVARHLTALARYGFSAPIQTLARFGFLDGSKTVFDYGCGRGDDMRGLRENNIEVYGWDPHYAPNEIKRRAHLVNLGFVINVIENLEERIEALRGAYGLADELLVVSAMLANQDAVKGAPYGDGVLTSRNTFQKYHTQSELMQFIAEVLHEEPLPVGPGIIYVFKDKDAEQRFLYGRVANWRNTYRLSRLSRPENPGHIDRAQAKYEQHRELLESLWKTTLLLGRDPDPSELAQLATITQAFGSLPAALRFIKSRKDHLEVILEEASQSRIDDLRVYFAQLQFQKRKPYRHTELGLQRDIKAFFGGYRTAVDLGRKLLFTIANIDDIGRACHTAAEHGIGWLEEGESLQLHTSMVEQLPPILRTYICCGTVLYGDVSSADLIKIHIRSGKLTLMKFDDFTNKPLPRMIQRVKISLRKQGLDIFDYGAPYTPPYLYRKSRFINETFDYYAEQLAFEEVLEGLTLFDFSGYGPPPKEFDEKLEQRRYQVEGFHLIRSQTIPNIDASCGQYLKYRDLIECGETQARTGLPNLPKEPDSYTALLELAINVLNPVIEYFGMAKLTYGFCSPQLAKQIPGKIAPELDQHAAHEKKTNGKPVCERLGAACDFLIADEDMWEVAHWVLDNTNVDRVYIYEKDHPIHISYSKNPARQLVHMASTSTGRRVPKVING